MDYDKLAVEKLDQLIGALGGLTDNKDKISDVLDKILGADSQNPGSKDDEENKDGDSAENVSGAGDGTGSSESTSGVTGTEGAGGDEKTGAENADSQTDAEGTEV